MDSKKLVIIIAIIVIAVIAVVGYVFSTGMLNGEQRQTTDFSNAFMEGKFTGNVSLANNTTYMQSWKDKENNIEYNISTVDNATAIFDIQDAQSILSNGGMSGFIGPEQRSFNGNDWNIYFTQGVSVGGNNTTDNKVMNIIICVSQGEKQGYLVYMVFDNSSDVGFRLSPLCDAYANYTEPLLKSINLKECKAPHSYEELGLSESDYKQQMELVHQIKAGNYSALQGATQ